MKKNFLCHLILILTSLNVCAHTLAPPTPSIDPVADPAAIASDAGQQTIQLTGITDNNNNFQGVTITASSDNTALIPDPSVHFDTPTSSTGSLTYTPQGSSGGTAIITIHVANAGVPDTYIEISFTVTVNAATTSILSSTEEASKILLYPNPIQNSFSINLSGEQAVEKLFICNLTGEKIKEIRISNTLEYIRTDDIPKGTYYVVLQKNDGNVLVKKIVKQ